MTLGSTAARGTAITLVGQLAKFSIQSISIVVLARIIAPEEFGLYVMVASIAGLAAVVGDFGLSAASIQAKTITQNEKSNLFWINVTLGCSGAVAVYFCAPLIGSFYGEPAILGISQAMCLVFVFNGLAVQHKAEMSRSMRFTSLTVLEIVSQTVGLVIALVLAFSGFGVWALVFQQVGSSAAVSLYAWIQAKWIPSRPTRKASVRKYLYFGANTMGGALTNYVSANADSVVLGKYAGAESVGLYGRMFQLFSLPLQQLATPLTRVALPVLSSIQDDQARYNRFMQRALGCMAYVFFFGFTIIFISAPEIVLLVLGDQWVAGAPVLQILAIGGIFQGIGYIYYWGFLSRARTGAMFRLSLVSRSLMVVGIVLAAPAGMYGVAVAVSVGLFVNWVINTVWGVPKFGMQRRSILIKIWRPALVMSLFAFGAFLLKSSINQAQTGNVAVLVGWVLGQFAYLALVAVIWPAARRDLAEIFGLVRMTRRAR